MSVPMTSERKRRRKFWFIPRFGLRTLLLATMLLGAALIPLAQSTRRQMLACERIKKLKDVIVTMHEPPTWLRFLPQALLKLGGGHWCQRVRSVQVFNRFEVKPEEGLAKIKEAIQLATQLPHLESISIRTFDRQPYFTNEQLRDCYASLNEIHGLREISFGSLRCDVHLIALPRLPYVEELHMHSSAPEGGLSGLSDVGMQELWKFPRLQKFHVSGEKVVGQSLSVLASLANIREIIFDKESRFATSDLNCFANHPTIERFDCPSSCDDDAVRIFASCPKLRFINLRRAPISKEGLACLCTIKNLEVLNIHGTSISDSEFSILANCKSLKDLDCSSCKLTDAIGPTLSQLRNLESLDLRDTQVSEAILIAVADLKKMNQFDLPDIPIQVDKVVSLQALRPHRYDYSSGREAWQTAYYHFGNDPKSTLPSTPKGLNLRKLSGVHGRIAQVRDLAGVTDIDLLGSDVDDSDLRTLAAACDIESIDISRTPITANGLELLKHESRLRSLVVGPFDDCAQALQQISLLSTLEYIDIKGLDTLSDADLTALKKLKHLKVIRIYDCELDQKSICSLCELPDLEYLRLNESTLLDERDIERNRLKQARETLGSPQGLLTRIAAKQNGDPSKSYNEALTLFDEQELRCLSDVQTSRIKIGYPEIQQHDIEALCRGGSINFLDLSGTNVSDDALKSISSLKYLVSLDLSNTPITDAAVDTLLQLKELYSLKIANTGITDAGVARILQSLNLEILDLSGTKTSLQAWDALNRGTRPVSQQLVVEDVPAAPEILTRLPSKWLPNYIATHHTSKGLHASVIRSIRQECSPNEPDELELNPDVLQAWPIEEVLKDKARLNHLRICNTGRVVEILQTVSGLCPKVQALEFNNEQFDDGAIYNFPTSLCTAQFKNCSISTSLLNSLARAAFLKRIAFESCDLENCSLEPLTAAKSLTRISRKDTNLTQDQNQTWKRLSSALERFW